MRLLAAAKPSAFLALARRLSHGLDRLELAAVVKVKAVLARVDRDIRRAILAASEAGDLTRRSMNSVIDDAIDRFSEERETIMRRAVLDALNAAQEFRVKITLEPRLLRPRAEISPSIAEDLKAIQAEGNRAFAEDLRARIKREIADGVIRGKTPNQIAADLVAKRIATPRRRPGEEEAHGALAQAEKLSRIEIRQQFNAQVFAGAKAEEKAGAKMLKSWVNQGDAAVRDTHVAAGRDYALGGRIGPIPVGQKFKVGKAKMQFPGDPSIIGTHPEEYWGCRCFQVILPEEE